MTPPVIILGMHRSGTSCLTGSLEEAGLNLGEVNLKTKCNEKGTRENVSIMELNDAVLATVGASWDNPPSEEITWRADHKAWRKELIKAAARDPIWGFKDPRTLFTLDGWLEALPGARLIATFRDPHAVAQSLNKRNGFPIERGLALWRAYNERLLAVCQTHDVAIINFDWSPTRYRGGLEMLCAEIGLQSPKNGFRFFEMRLRRNDSASHRDLQPPLSTIHQRLRRAARISMRGAQQNSGGNKPSVTLKKKSDEQGALGADINDRIASLEATLNNGDARPELLDNLGDLLACRDRWAEAENAYRRAQRARSALIGFRSGHQERAHPTTPEAARTRLNELCKMAARFGAQYWAEDLSTLLVVSAGAAKAQDAEPCWPQRRTLPQREYTPIGPRDENRHTKKLSVMLPVYGIEREDWFREALDSVLSQKLDPASSEIIVVDDASETRDAQAIAESYGGRVQYRRNEKNLGLIDNHNRCIAEAAGDFIHILHQDDRIQPGFYDALLPVLSENPDFVASVSNTAYINAAGAVTSQTPPPQQTGVLDNWRITLSLQLRIQFPSIIVRRRTYESIGGFSRSLKFSFDWDLWNRVAASGSVWFDPRHLVQYRVHEGSATYGFGWRERVDDAMQTVSHMVRLLPQAQRRATAEMAMHKFFQRYWLLLSKTPPQGTNSDQQALIDFLLSGWTTPDEQRDLSAFFTKLRSITEG